MDDYDKRARELLETTAGYERLTDELHEKQVQRLASALRTAADNKLREVETKLVGLSKLFADNQSDALTDVAIAHWSGKAELAELLLIAVRALLPPEAKEGSGG